MYLINIIHHTNESRYRLLTLSRCIAFIGLFGVYTFYAITFLASRNKNFLLYIYISSVCKDGTDMCRHLVDNNPHLAETVP